MNKKILILSILIALVFSFAIYGYYVNLNKKNFIYLMQVGAYKNYDNAIEISKNIDNYFIIKEEDLYKVFIGITASDEVYSKLLDLYALEFNSYKKTVHLNDKELTNKIIKYDSLIKKIDSKEEVDMIIKEEFKLLSNITIENV